MFCTFVALVLVRYLEVGHFFAFVRSSFHSFSKQCCTGLAQSPLDGGPFLSKFHLSSFLSVYHVVLLLACLGIFLF